MSIVVYMGKSNIQSKPNCNTGTVMFFDKEHHSGYIVLEQAASDSFISIKELAEDVHETDKVEFCLSASGEALNVHIKR